MTISANSARFSCESAVWSVRTTKQTTFLQRQAGLAVAVWTADSRIDTLKDHGGGRMWAICGQEQLNSGFTPQLFFGEKAGYRGAAHLRMRSSIL